MKFSLVFLGTASAFTVPQSTVRTTTVARQATSVDEFEYLLQESNEISLPATHSRRRVAFTSNDDAQTTILASTFAQPTSEMALQEETEETIEGVEAEEGAVDPEAAELDPFADTQQLQKIQQFKEQPAPTLASKFKQMDLQDIIITLIVPSIALFAAGRWGYNRVAGRVQDNLDGTLDAFAREMIYHDGDFKEMELCVQDYGRRLVWLGPNKKDAMLKRYLESYAKKKTISPQAIASLSYAFTIFKLSEAKAASLLVALCKQMGTDKISSAGKLLFLGSRILKSPEGVAALSPIKDLIKSTYRDAEVAEMLVETSQQ